MNTNHLRSTLCAVVLMSFGSIALPNVNAAGDRPQELTGRMHHLRGPGEREWSEFPEQAEAERLELNFTAEASDGELTLVLLQQDVKQTWRVVLNNRELGRLPVDENDMLVCFAIPGGTLKEGENKLVVEQLGNNRKVDDIRVGEVRIVPLPRAEYLRSAIVKVSVKNTDGQSIPARITVLNEQGSLQTVGGQSSETLAIRPGVIYTATGEAEFGLPPGKYTVYAGRGIEYSLDRWDVDLQPSEHAERTLTLRREVPTEGYVACDTHLHTLTFSGHGDATIEERMITLAGEGIELPIATDHNRHVDYEPIARQLGVRRYFTPVVGNEVTTGLGHFNVFPVLADGSPPDSKATDWVAIFQGIHRTAGAKVVILNHARDLHAGTRPFGPRVHNGPAGANVAGWRLQANAMEVINSGSVQSDPMQLIHDWMASLNHGQLLTPVGGSDSHDVGRHFVGQGRTYIRARDDDSAAIHIDEAVTNFLQGRVLVSYGLLCEMTVDDKYGPGELAIVAATPKAKVRVLGPHWAKADKVLLFANGELARTVDLSAEKSGGQAGVLAEFEWQPPVRGFDTHLVAVATGPGIRGLYWPTAKPYQPTSPDFQPMTLGLSGAVWLDGDKDGRKTPAIDYARLLVAKHPGNLGKLLEQLRNYDTAVAIQAAHLWQEESATADRASLLDSDSLERIARAAPHVRDAFTRYLTAWRENQQAMAK